MIVSSDSKYSMQRQPKRITSNALVLFVRMLIVTIINLYSVRFVIKGLGGEDYGIFNAVVGVVMTCSCVFPVLAISVQRFYSYAMGEGAWGRLREIFSASVNIIVFSLVVIIVLLETIGLFFIREKLQIPIERMEEAELIFHLAMVTFSFSYLQIPYTAALFAHENFGIYAGVSCLDCVLKFVVALFIGKVCFSGLTTYAVGLSVVSLCTWLCYVVACSKYSECRYYMVRNHGIYKDLLSFSGWTMYGSFAGVGMIQGNNILLNVFFGPLANAAFGVAVNIYNAFTSLSNTVALPFRPQMIKSYAAGNFAYLRSLFFANNKFIIYLLSCIAIPLVFEMPMILDLWISKAFTEMSVFSSLFIVYAVLLSLHNPITILIQASGRIRTYHLVAESIMILCLPVTWVLFRMGMPAYVAFISMIVLCGVAHVARVICLKRMQGTFSLASYFSSILLPCVLVAGGGGGVSLIIYVTMEPGVLRLGLMLLASPLVTLCLAYFVGMTSYERSMVNEIFRKFLRR